MAYSVRKTEHCGAKNGGGFWGLRVEAKAASDRVRRANDRVAQREWELEFNSDFDGTFIPIKGLTASASDTLYIDR